MQEIYMAGDDIPFVELIRDNLSNKPFICRELSELMDCHSNVASALIKRCIDADIIDEQVDNDLLGFQEKSDHKKYFVTTDGKTANLLDSATLPDEEELIDLDEKKFGKIRKCLRSDCKKEFWSQHFGHRICNDHKSGGKVVEQEDFNIHATIDWGTSDDP